MKDISTVELKDLCKDEAFLLDMGIVDYAIRAAKRHNEKKNNK